MSQVTDISEPASELEHLITELSESGLLVFASASAGGRRPWRYDDAGIRWTGRPAVVAHRTG